MDTIPLINPKLIKVSAATDNTSGSVLRAEVVSSTPSKESNSEKASSNQQQEYKVVLQVGKQQLETVSTSDLKKGSQIDVKILPGPELRIINKPSEKQLPEKPIANSQLTAAQTLALQAKPLVQQLLADRTPQLQQQELPNLIKQLSQLINQPSNTLQAKSPESNIASQLITSTEIRSENLIATKPPTATKPSSQQVLANKFYQQQADIQTKTQSTALNPTSTRATIEQLKTWIQQLPKDQDIASSTGLRNALNNAGIQAENQLSDLAQQSLNLPNKKSANSIFQQLQTLQQNAAKDLALKDQSSSTASTEAKPDLAAIIKKTAKTLSDNSQQVLSNLIKTKAPSNTASISTLSASVAPSTPPNSAIPAPTTTATSLSTSQWQNPLLNNAQMTLEELLQAPLLQNPSSNNKFALSQILTGHSLANQGNQPDGNFRIPLNWNSGVGSGVGNENALIRNLQNLLGHIEREQIQQMQTGESNQANNPNQLQQSQQWIPLLINHQQQLQLIEFFLDKEERIDEQGQRKQHWFINLHFDLPKLGKLGIEICMLDNECSTTFWSESTSSLSELTQNIQPLRERLTEQGIVVSDIQSRHGTLEKRKHNIQQRLIDVKT